MCRHLLRVPACDPPISEPGFHERRDGSGIGRMTPREYSTQAERLFRIFGNGSNCLRSVSFSPLGSLTDQKADVTTFVKSVD